MTVPLQTSCVHLDIAADADLPRFRKDLQDAFAIAVVEQFGSVGDDGPIPSDSDLQASLEAPNAIVHRILENGRWVGGAVVSIDPDAHRNSLDLFFVRADSLGRGDLPLSFSSTWS